MKKLETMLMDIQEDLFDLRTDITLDKGGIISREDKIKVIQEKVREALREIWRPTGKHELVCNSCKKPLYDNNGIQIDSLSILCAKCALNEI